MSTIPLKPCPFCGGNNLQLTNLYYENITCFGCGIIFSTKEEGPDAEKWNRRPGDE